MANGTDTLQTLVEQTAPLTQEVPICAVTCMADPQGYVSLASGWNSGPLAATVPLSGKQQELDALIDQMAPPPPADAQTESQVTQLLIGIVEGSSSNLTAALDELDKLSWTSRFTVMESLTRAGPTLDGQNYLEILQGQMANLPNVDSALNAAAIAVLMNHGGRTLSSIDITVNFMQSITPLAERDQWHILSKLGLRGFAIEGVMASINSEAIASGTLQVAGELLTIFGAKQGSTAIGKWNPPGNMPGGYYIGWAAHVAIAAEYRAANPGSHIFTNTTPIDTILTQLQAQLMFKGNRVAVALGISRPDIFDFSLAHPVLPPGWVYEIKPWNSLATAEYEALFYADALILAGIPSMPGPIGTPGTFGCLPAPGGWYVYSALLPGAIVYWYRKATNAELQAQGLVPIPNPIRQQTLAALDAAGAAAPVVAEVGILAAILAALEDAGWSLAFLAL